MATIVNTLIDGLSQKMIQARLNTADAKPFLYGQYFPVKKVNGFNWQTLTNQLTKNHVAGDVHADNGTIVRKKRPIFQSAKGDIPYIAISREMSRSEIKDYQTAAALAPDADASALVNYWGGDVDFCFDGVNSELEYIAWALASNAGKLSFTTSNNATFANEFDLDYDVDSDNKKYTGTNWGTANSADVIGDLVTLIKAGKAMGLNPKFAFVNLDTFYKIASSDQIIKACASFASNALNIAQTPDLAQVNQMLARQAWLNGVQFRVIDQSITRELQDGSQSSANPFATDRLILAEKEVLGTTQYDVLNESSPLILKAQRSHITVKKYGTIEPKAEITIGEADALPVLDTAYRNIYVKTDGNAWS